MWIALFPGQGSQTVGMGRFLYDEFAIARASIEEASDTLKQDFKTLLFEGPESDLALTENTQPALLAVSTATFRVIQQELGIQISAAAGHSIGEYAAVVSAGALSYADGLRSVRIRGRAMQKAVPVGQGGMAAVMGMTDDQVIRLCAWVHGQTGFVLEPANFNAPGQVVISGDAKAITWLKENAKPEALQDAFPEGPPRVKLIPLTVSAPFHCSLMKPAEEEMRLVLNATPFHSAHFPIVQNVTARETSDARTLKENLITQVSGAVRWTQCMTRLKELAADQAPIQFIEFGAGKVLSGLAKKIDSASPPPFNINALDDIKTLETAMKPASVSH